MSSLVPSLSLLWTLGCAPPQGSIGIATEPVVDTGETGGAFAGERLVILEEVHNASGLALLDDPALGPSFVTARDGDLEDGPAPRVSWSSEEDGRLLGQAGPDPRTIPGELEAMTARGQTLAYLAQQHHLDAASEYFLIVDGQVLPVADGALEGIIREEAAHAGLVVSGHLVCEGLATLPEGWLAACGTPPEAPEGTFGYFIQLGFDGHLMGITGPLRDEQGEIFSDFLGSLDVTPDGLPLVGGFLKPVVYFFSPDGTVLRRLASPIDRIEGIALDVERDRVVAVRECTGSDACCDEAQGEVTLAVLPPS
ncbi:MAG: hypothetical protein ABIO70_36405 [Pseudomonadota bacterium]